MFSGLVHISVLSEEVSSEDVGSGPVRVHVNETTVVTNSLRQLNKMIQVHEKNGKAKIYTQSSQSSSVMTALGDSNHILGRYSTN